MFHRGYICTCWVADYQIPIEGWWSRTQEEPIQTFCIIFSRPCISFVTSMSHKCRRSGWQSSDINCYELVSMERGWQLHNAETWPQQNTLTGQENIWNWGKYYNLQFWLSIISRSNGDTDFYFWLQITDLTTKHQLLCLKSEVLSMVWTRGTGGWSQGVGP